MPRRFRDRMVFVPYVLGGAGVCWLLAVLAARLTESLGWVAATWVLVALCYALIGVAAVWGWRDSDL